MEKKKNLTLLWRKLNQLEFGKDVILIPYYLGQALEYQVDICCGYSKEVAAQIPCEEKEGLRFVRRRLGHNPLLRIPVYIMYLLQNASHIDLLVCFHWRLETFINILFYKLLNKKGQVYIKSDTISGKEWDLSAHSAFSKAIRIKLYTACLNRVSVISCETSQAYQLLCNNIDFKKKLEKKLVWMPNAFDETYFDTLGINERTYPEKENLMITVGRIGALQKNTQMILKALGNTDLNGWKFALIGPIEESFRQVIEQFYINHPDKKEQVVFTDQIDNKNELWEWYNKAKVFVSSSRWESYGLVLIEAKRFRNYIVSTRVGAAEDLIEQGRYGVFVEQENTTELSHILSRIAHGQIDIDVYQDYDTHQLSYPQKITLLLKHLRK